jgi:hypothetical protein
LLFGLIDPRLLGLDLRVDIRDAALRLVDLGVRLVEGRPVVALVDAREHGTRLDQLIVDDRHVNDRAVDLGTDRDGARIDECIVGRLVLARIKPPGDPAHDRSDEKEKDRKSNDRMSEDGRSPSGFVFRRRARLVCPSLLACRRKGLWPLLRTRVRSGGKRASRAAASQSARSRISRRARDEGVEPRLWKGAPLMRAAARPPAVLANERSLRKFLRNRLRHELEPRVKR